MDWKVGDWVVYDLKVGQIKRLCETGVAAFSDGFCETSGNIADRFRPLTLKNKRIVETFDIYYGRLKSINGEGGFNYPDIHRYFSQLALDAIDGDEKDATPYDKAQNFVSSARDYRPVIDGVGLFRRKLG